MGLHQRIIQLSFMKEFFKAAFTNDGSKSLATLGCFAIIFLLNFFAGYVFT